MGEPIFINELKRHLGNDAIEAFEVNCDEIHARVAPGDFKKACLFAHKRLHAPVAALFAADERTQRNAFDIFCVFLSTEFRKWFVIVTAVDPVSPRFDSLAKDMFSASLFERQISEMFGIEPLGSPDTRRLNLHDEVWPQGWYPLRKDFSLQQAKEGSYRPYVFNHVSGVGIFEVPVGPVHAGIIGPGHFRFSAAGEPIVNLEARLGFTHRGIEKIMEGSSVIQALKISECVCGDSAFAHGWAFCNAVEKICSANIPAEAVYARVICLELERLYNHVNDIGGMATDVSFSFPAQFASSIKENILALNERLTGSRYLKNFNCVGGVTKCFQKLELRGLSETLKKIDRDIFQLEGMLFGSVSFMDRLDDTGVLRKNTAEDLGAVGLVARASGIGVDLRKIFSRFYQEAGFVMAKDENGDALSRLKIRFREARESSRLISFFSKKLIDYDGSLCVDAVPCQGFAIGAVEAWRGQVLYWVRINNGIIERCKIVDASFHNWPALSFAVLGNIIPDFPLCNKSFDLSYAANDL